MDTISVFSCSIKKNINESQINSDKEIEKWIQNHNKKYKISFKK